MENLDMVKTFFIFAIGQATLFYFILLYVLFSIMQNTTQKVTKQKPVKQKDLSLLSAKNTKVLVAVKNDVSDYQKIKTSEVVLPVIAATVLEYAPGELGESFSGITKLYYSPEALDDKEFLESVIRSPWNVKTHELNTSEANVSVNGWAREAWYDSKDKTVYAKGFIIGEDNIEYAKDNLNKPSFGTSAYISFLKIDKEKGTTLEGLKYDAIARKAVCNHVAILPNIRDEKNKIVSINAKNAKIETTKKKLNGVKNMAIDKEEFKEAIQAYEEEKNADEANVDKLVNAVMAKMAKNEEEKKNSKNEEPAKEEPKKEPTANGEEPAKEEPKKEPTANGEEPAKEEPKKEPTANGKEPAKEEPKNEDEAKAENALPSQKIVAAFSEAYDTVFKKTPTFKHLAEIAELPHKSFTTAMNAVREKYKEFEKANAAKPSVSNSETEKTIAETLKEF